MGSYDLGWILRAENMVGSMHPGQTVREAVQEGVNKSLLNQSYSSLEVTASTAISHHRNTTFNTSRTTACTAVKLITSTLAVQLKPGLASSRGINEFNHPG